MKIVVCLGLEKLLSSRRLPLVAEAAHLSNSQAFMALGPNVSGGQWTRNRKTSASELISVPNAPPRPVDEATGRRDDYLPHVGRPENRCKAL